VNGLPDHDQGLLKGWQGLEGLERLTAVEVALAIHPFVPGAPCCLACELAHAGVGNQGLNMGHLLPEVPWCPTDIMADLVMPHNVAPSRAAAVWAEELLQPFVAQNQDWMCLDD
jgi:hypothetical protein